MRAALRVGARRACALLAVLWLAPAAPALAQAADADPAPPPSEDDPGAVDRVRRWLEARSDQLGQAGVQLRLASFAQGTGAAPGFDYRQRITEGLQLQLSAAQSLREDTLLQLRVGRLDAATRTLQLCEDRDGHGAGEQRASHTQPSWLAYAELSHRRLESGRVFDAGRELSFSSAESAVDAVVGRTLGPHAALSAHLGWYRAYSDDLEALRLQPEAPSLPGFGWAGLERRLDFFRVGAQLAYDSRDRPADARRGGFVSVSGWRFLGSGPSEGHGFSRFSLDARGYVPLGSRRHVLALRALASLSRAGDNGVPLHLQHTLGGSRLLRGYPGFRFRGHDLLAGSAEYRFELVRRLELAAFGDVGGVRGGLAPSDGTGLLWSAGAGLRLKTLEAVLLRLDVAWGRDGAETHVKLGTSF